MDDEPQDQGQSPILAEPAEAVTVPEIPHTPRQGSVKWQILAAICGASTAFAAFAALALLAQRQPDLFGLGQSAGVTQQLADQGQRLNDLTAAVTQLASQPGSAAALKQVTAGQTALSDQTAALVQEVRALTERLAKLESQPQPVAGEVAAEAAAQSAKDMENARAALAAAESQKTAADAAARRALIEAAVGQLNADLQSGAAMGDALKQLQDAGVEIPAALGDQAQGAPTLQALRAAFPDAARDALAQSLPEVSGTSLWDRGMAFLRSQTGARSLTPRAGDDPDAVLSRAEAALASDDLATALKELSALPPPGRARMAEWSGLADRRLQAKTAIAALAAMAAQ